MANKWDIIEEVIELTDNKSINCFFQPIKGQVKIRGRFIKDEAGKLRPVLVKTSYFPATTEKQILETPWSTFASQTTVSSDNTYITKNTNKWYNDIWRFFNNFVRF